MFSPVPKILTFHSLSLARKTRSSFLNLNIEIPEEFLTCVTIPNVRREEST